MELYRRQRQKQSASADAVELTRAVHAVAPAFLLFSAASVLSSSLRCACPSPTPTFSAIVGRAEFPGVGFARCHFQITAMSDSGAPPVLQRPESPWHLFVAFTLLALQGFGGVLAIAQRVLVEQRRWVTREQFVEILAVGQVLPGPNVCNISLMIGDRFFGWRGA